jgi:hypothetical protein
MWPPTEQPIASKGASAVRCRDTLIIVRRCIQDEGTKKTTKFHSLLK